MILAPFVSGNKFIMVNLFPLTEWIDVYVADRSFCMHWASCMNVFFFWCEGQVYIMSMLMNTGACQEIYNGFTNPLK